MKGYARVICLVFGLALAMVAVNLRAEEPAIWTGSKVAFDYLLLVDNEGAVDQSKPGQPFEYTHGDGSIIPGLARQLTGLKAGDSRIIEVLPEEGYGPANPQLIREVPASQLPPDVIPEAGKTVQFTAMQGNLIAGRVTEVKDNSVVIDSNHPLAGKTLIFQVMIVSVK